MGLLLLADCMDTQINLISVGSRGQNDGEAALDTDSPQPLRDLTFVVQH